MSNQELGDLFCLIGVSSLLGGIVLGILISLMLYLWNKHK